MTKLQLVLMVFLIGSTSLCAQRRSTTSEDSYSGTALVRKGLTIDLYGTQSTFQDARFSPVQFSGMGFGLGLGLVKRTIDRERRFGIRADVIPNLITGRHTGLSYSNLRAKVSYDQQRPIGDLLGCQWLVGGELSTAVSIYSSSSAGNNSNRIRYGVGLLALTTLRIPIGNSLLSVSTGLKLLNYGNETSSFTFSTPQSTLENGEFSYENDSSRKIFGAPILSILGNPFEFQTRLNYQFGKRLGIIYEWQLLRDADVKGRALVLGLHNAGVSYTF